MKMNRRDFLKGAGRVTAVGGLSLLVLRLIRKNTIIRGETCINKSICSGCGIVSSCALPPALSRRRVEEGNG